MKLDQNEKDGRWKSAVACEKIDSKRKTASWVHLCETAQGT